MIYPSSVRRTGDWLQLVSWADTLTPFPGRGSAYRLSPLKVGPFTFLQFSHQLLLRSIWQPTVQEVLPHSPEIDNKKMLIGVLIVIGIAISWVGSTQLAQSAFSADFNAPFLITWFSTSWMSAVFPLYILPSLLRGIRIRSFYRYAQRKNKIYLHTQVLSKGIVFRLPKRLLLEHNT